MGVPFLDLRRETERLQPELQAAINRVLARGHFILGPEVEEFERAFAAFCGSANAIGVASGTDAVTIALQAVGVAPGDEVITAANTCIPTIVGIERAGATPVLADVDEVSFTLDPESVAGRLTKKTRAIVPVHLYGQTADMGALMDLAEAHGLAVVEDCAQAHAAEWQGRRAGSIGHAAAFSFYPTKNLGALGDGGAVVTADPVVADRARLLRNYGERARFEHVVRGLNSRLDELQAAVLAAKLPQLLAANDRRRELAAVYYGALEGSSGIRLPAELPGRLHVYHLFVVRTANRAQLRRALDDAAIGTAVHYPIPVHRQPAYLQLGEGGTFPVTERLASEILSLPMSADHTESELMEVAAAIEAAG